MKSEKELSYVEHDGRQTAYKATDPEVDVLCVHGSGGTHRVWKSQLARLDADIDADAGVAALDLSGHGESDDVDTEPGQETLEAYAEDVLAVAEETNPDVLVGNSLGGAVAQHIALDHDHGFDALVLAGTGAKLSVLPKLLNLLESDEGFDDAVDFLHSEDLLLHDPDAKYAEHSREAMQDVGREVTSRDFHTCNEFDVRDRLEEIELPTLAVVGEYDRLTPVDYHEYFSQHMPNCKLQVLPDVAHLAMLEEPDEFNSVLNDFLKNKFY